MPPTPSSSSRSSVSMLVGIKISIANCPADTDHRRQRDCNIEGVQVCRHVRQHCRRLLPGKRSISQTQNDVLHNNPASPPPTINDTPFLGGATLFLHRASSRSRAMRESSIHVRKHYGL
ncbi:DNA-binding storekeeper protein-relatedtranscriptional regulator [Striga asiatica]|uniref:DNA-binding storekeeper protein-relatedtranscriptional regulator n=1 Tax=Striga asiatica TaxID=4170 RepID=A0A5A7PV37_STRAF|nr:DNA-binding storekeeper protein-relatedtranscriptional regulator [Striga asiatica]